MKAQIYFSNVFQQQHDVHTINRYYFSTCCLWGFGRFFRLLLLCCGRPIVLVVIELDLYDGLFGLFETKR
jgi:hypothetical protein